MLRKHDAKAQHQISVPFFATRQALPVPFTDGSSRLSTPFWRERRNRPSHARLGGTVLVWSSTAAGPAALSIGAGNGRAIAQQLVMVMASWVGGWTKSCAVATPPQNKQDRQRGGCHTRRAAGGQGQATQRQPTLSIALLLSYHTQTLVYSIGARAVAVAVAGAVAGARWRGAGAAGAVG